MINTLPSQPLVKKPSLVPQYDDSDTASDITMLSTASSAEPLNGRFGPIDSDGRSLNSYTSSLDRDFILKDVHGRTINSTNEVGIYLHP